MRQTQRHDAIIELVRRQGYISTEELIEHFAVSPQTVRRDLNDLAEQNKINRHQGGAALPSSSVNTAYHDRKMMCQMKKHVLHVKSPAKSRMVLRCLDGATLFIDIVTTPEAVAYALLQHDCLCVVAA